MQRVSLLALVFALSPLSAYASVQTFNLGTIDPSPELSAGYVLPQIKGAFDWVYTFDLAVQADVGGTVAVTVHNTPALTGTEWALYSGAPGSGALVNSGVFGYSAAGVLASYSATVSNPGPNQLLPGLYYFEFMGKVYGTKAYTPTLSLLAVDSPAIPELSTWGMFGLGFAGLALAGMNKRTSARLPV